MFLQNIALLMQHASIIDQETGILGDQLANFRVTGICTAYACWAVIPARQIKESVHGQYH